MNALPEVQPKQVLSYTFTYDGAKRHVDNVEIDGDAQQILGYETRKSGRFSGRIKRYSLIKIQDLVQVPPLDHDRKLLGSERPE